MDPTFEQVQEAASHNFLSAVKYSGSLDLRIDPENHVPPGATALRLNRYLDDRTLDLVNHLKDRGIEAMPFTSSDGPGSSNGKQHVTISIEGDL